ncbi:hypothetical protein PGB90_009675 [Kerria lacca]
MMKLFSLAFCCIAAICLYIRNQRYRFSRFTFRRVFLERVLKELRHANIKKTDHHFNY